MDVNEFFSLPATWVSIGIFAFLVSCAIASCYYGWCLCAPAPKGPYVRPSIEVAYEQSIARQLKAIDNGDRIDRENELYFNKRKYGEDRPLVNAQNESSSD